MCYPVTLLVTDKQTDRSVYHPRTQSFPHGPHYWAFPKAEGPPGDILVRRQIPAKLGLTGGSRTWLLFHILGLEGEDVEWLDQAPSYRDISPGYYRLEKFLGNLSIVNDTAERGVELIQVNCIEIIHT